MWRLSGHVGMYITVFTTWNIPLTWQPIKTLYRSSLKITFALLWASARAVTLVTLLLQLPQEWWHPQKKRSHCYNIPWVWLEFNLYLNWGISNKINAIKSQIEIKELYNITEFGKYLSEYNTLLKTNLIEYQCQIREYLCWRRLTKHKCHSFG